MFKKAFFKLDEVTPLNIPEQVSNSFVKTALNKLDSYFGFDLESEIKKHPDSLFVKCFAIKADEMNDNGDYFSESELKKSFDTFVGVPVFTNHQNSDINQARGKVVHSWWDDAKNGISLIARVDSAAYPQLARGIKQEYIISTSMGATVKYSCCSICHNYAEDPSSYCSHIKERKTRLITAKNVQCNYHKNGPDKKCPICGCQKGESKTFDVSKKAFEYNYGIKFIENSFVTQPACHDCGVTEIFDPKDLLQKVSRVNSKIPSLMKMNSIHRTRVEIKDLNDSNYSKVEHLNQLIPGLIVINDHRAFVDSDVFKARLENVQLKLPELLANNCTLTKIAGQKEIGELNQALDLLTSVSQSMLQQKDQLDMEFLSDLVSVLADLQTVTDELTQQGYGRLQSPNDGQSKSTGAPETLQTTPETQTPQVTHAVKPTPGGGSKVQSGEAGAVGTFTSPTANKKINLEKLSQDMFAKNKEKTIDFKMKIEENNEREIKMPFKISRKSS